MSNLFMLSFYAMWNWCKIVASYTGVYNVHRIWQCGCRMKYFESALNQWKICKYDKNQRHMFNIKFIWFQLLSSPVEWKLNYSLLRSFALVHFFTLSLSSRMSRIFSERSFVRHRKNCQLNQSDTNSNSNSY